MFHLSLVNLLERHTVVLVVAVVQTQERAEPQVWVALQVKQAVLATVAQLTLALAEAVQLRRRLEVMVALVSSM
jgi:hypothetical protein